MNPAFDLGAYLARIAYRGSLEPCADLVRALQERHVLTMAFENIDPLIACPVSLDRSRIVDKLVARGRGGYCLEQNALFAVVLESLGFRVTPLLARVEWMRPPGLPPPPRRHLLLRVESDVDDLIVDVGFSPLTPTAPLRLGLTGPQATSHETFRLEYAHGAYAVSVVGAQGWLTLYRFDLSPATPAECHAVNVYASTARESPFVRQLIVCRALPRGRLVLSGGRCCVRESDGRRHSLQRFAAHEVADVLRDRFGIALSAAEGDALEHRLKRGMDD